MATTEKAFDMSVEKFSAHLNQKNSTIAQMSRSLDAEKQRYQRLEDQVQASIEREKSAARLRSEQLEGQLQEATVKSKGLAVALSQAEQWRREMLEATGLLENETGL